MLAGLQGTCPSLCYCLSLRVLVAGGTTGTLSSTRCPNRSQTSSTSNEPRWDVSASERAAAGGQGVPWSRYRSFTALSPERVEQVWQACIVQEDGRGTSSDGKRVS